MAVGHDLTVLVQLVVEVREPAAHPVPLVPAGQGRVDLRQVAVHQLAQKRRAVSGGLQPGGDGRLAQAQGLELGEAARGQVVALDAMVVGVLAAQERGPRRAAEGVGDEVVLEDRALVGDQLLGPLHHTVRGHILVIRQDHHDAGRCRSLGHQHAAHCEQESAQQRSHQSSAHPRESHAPHANINDNMAVARDWVHAVAHTQRRFRRRVVVPTRYQPLVA